MIGYKAFDKDLKCRGMQFEVGKTYTTGAKENLKLCSDTVIHFCRELNKIESVSSYTIANSRICEVIASGEIVDDGEKYGTNEITILRELPEEEKNKFNHWNSGDRNTGNYNSGDRNTGDRNSGNSNSGDRNSGDWNSGNRNSGNRNSGNSNSGDRNSGNRNSGNCNSGDWNSGDCNSGFFNSNEPNVRMFNKETNVKRFDVDIPNWCNFGLTVWVSHDTATDKEKEEHNKEIEICGGFLKTIDYKDAWRLAWDKASVEERKQLFTLPNWDNKIFKEITGIDAEAELEKE